MRPEARASFREQGLLSTRIYEEIMRGRAKFPNKMQITGPKAKK